MSKSKKEIVVYPNEPEKANGYTMEWIEAYLKDKATPKEIKTYAAAIVGKTTSEKKKIFVSMFIRKEDEFAKKLLKMAKEKAKKAKEEEE